MAVLESRISLVKKKKKKRVDSEGGESTSNKSSGSDKKQLCRENRLWEHFSPGIHTYSTPSALSPSYFAGLKLRETQMLAGDNTIITASSWAVLQCIKLGLTSPFSPTASHQKFIFLRDMLKKTTRGLQANVQHRGMVTTVTVTLIIDGNRLIGEVTYQVKITRDSILSNLHFCCCVLFELNSFGLLDCRSD